VPEFLPAAPPVLAWDDAELARLFGFLRPMSDRRDHQAFAAIRNAVTGAFRLLRVPGIAAQLRASRRDPYRLPLQLLGLAALPSSPA